MMAGPLFTPSVDSKGAVGEEKCENGARKSSPEKRGSKAEEGGFRQQTVVETYFIY